MIKKLLLVVFLLSVCTGCGAQRQGDSRNFISRDTVAIEGNSIVRTTNGAHDVLIDISQDFVLKSAYSGGTLWVPKSGADSQVAVIDYFGVSSKRLTVVGESRNSMSGPLEVFVPEQKIVDEGSEYRIELRRARGDGYISYWYLARKQVADGWINYHIVYREPLPSELCNKPWNASFDFGGTYLDDFIKRAQASFTIRSF